MILFTLLLLLEPALATDYVDGDYGGDDLELVDGDTLGGVLTNLGTVTIPVDATVTVTTATVELYASRVVIDGTLSADGAGDPGGLGALPGPLEGDAGIGVGGGVGGGPGPCMHGGGGGGGGYGGAGGVGGHLDGAEPGWGVGGAAHGTNELVVQEPGSGGGGGGSACSWAGRSGGAGGGSLYIVADEVMVSGAITSHGADGETVDDEDDDGGPGGGGSGGAIVIDTPILGGGGRLSAHGGVGGSAGGRWAGGGGGGGGGRIVVVGDYRDLSYSTEPGEPGRANHYEPDLWPGAGPGEGGSIDISGGGPPVGLVLDGACPGPVTVTADGMAPGAPWAILQARGVGDHPMPAGRCLGTETGLGPEGFAVLVRGAANADGLLELARPFPERICNSKLQLIDLSTCRVSTVERF